MKLVAYPGCCTARILVGFGGTATADWTYKPDRAASKEDVVKYVDENLTFWERAGIAIIHTTINSDQVAAKEGLLASGFTLDTVASKRQHAEVMLMGLTLNVRATLETQRTIKASAKKLIEAAQKPLKHPRNVGATFQSFQEGDRVIAVAPDDRDEHPSWTEEMDALHRSKEPFEIVRMRRGVISLGVFNYHPEWLFKVDEQGRPRDIHGRFVKL